jgi:hypothetical protein
MELLTTLFLFVAALAIVAYGIVTEATDWIGRAEIIEQRWPGLWRIMNNRPMRLILLAVAVAMIGHATEDFEKGAESPEVIFRAPRVPELARLDSVPLEPADSLRRRTMRIANEVSDFLRNRFESHPPYAYPDSRDPNPSDERKAAIKKCLEYDQQTTDQYMRRYKDLMVGIVKEYAAKGVSTGFLEQSFTQRVPVWGIPGSVWEDSPQNELGQFKELAFHVNAKDQMISPNF